jgi:hypothetical protein
MNVLIVEQASAASMSLVVMWSDARTAEDKLLAVSTSIQRTPVAGSLTAVGREFWIANNLASLPVMDGQS